MKTALSTHIINNVTDLRNVIDSAIRASGAQDKNMECGACVYVVGFDRATVQLETLSDGSGVINLVFHNATAAQKRRERE